MRTWKSIRSKSREIQFFVICVCCTILLFLVMKSETMFTDAGLSVATVAIAASSYKRQRVCEKMRQSLAEFEAYLEKVRYELAGGRLGTIVFGNEYVENFNCEGMAKCYYHRVFCALRDVNNTLGCQSTSGIADVIGDLQETVIKEHDLQQNICRELSGLKWIILSAIPAMPLVRAWVTANISEIEFFYKGTAGVLLKYGIWMFTLLVFMLFDRLEEIKSEEYT